MNGLRNICVALTCLLIVADCKYKRDDECEALAECQDPIEGYVLREGDISSFSSFPNEAALDEFCVLAESARSCVAEKKAGCITPEVRENVDSVEAAASFICTDEGRRETLQIAQSECITDETIQLEANEGIHNCVERFEFDVRMLTYQAISLKTPLQRTDMCPFLESWIDCTVTVVTEKCGQAYGNFMKRVLEASTEQIEVLDCAEAFNRKRATIMRLRK